MLNRSEILTKAWANYRRDVKMGYGVRRGEAFNRAHFAYCLRMAWAVAKEVAARAATVKPAPVAKVCADPVRAEAIRTELRDMEFGNFVDWNRHAALGAELARLGA